MRRTTLTVRTVIVTCVVALVSLPITALLAVPLSIRNANREAADRLVSETMFAQDLMRPRIATKRTNDEVALAQRLRNRGIDIYVIREGVPDREGLPDIVTKTISANLQVGVRRALVDGRWMLIAGRPLPNHSGVVLAEKPPNM